MQDSAFGVPTSVGIGVETSNRNYSHKWKCIQEQTKFANGRSELLRSAFLLLFLGLWRVPFPHDEIRAKLL